jgi:DNA-binding PadR family transcriptional regulator
MAGQTLAHPHPNSGSSCEEPRQALPISRWHLAIAEQSSVAINVNSVRHWLVLALVIERPSYGYELAMRYKQRFALILPPGANNVYSSLDKLENNDLIAQQHSVKQRATRGPRGKRAYYEATLKGVNAHHAWLVSTIKEEQWKMELLARIATATSIGMPGLRRLVDNYERHALKDFKRATRLMPNQDEQTEDTRTLLSALIGQEQRMKCVAEQRWAASARQAIDTFERP